MKKLVLAAAVAAAVLVGTALGTAGKADAHHTTPTRALRLGTVTPTPKGVCVNGRTYVRFSNGRRFVCRNGTLVPI